MQIRELANYGFDYEAALELCIGEEDILKEVLETAIEEGQEKIPLMNDLMTAGDFDRYIIEAHGLKNAAKQFGAMELSEMAKASELNGKAGDFEFLKNNHEALMAKYQEAVDIMSKVFED